MVKYLCDLRSVPPISLVPTWHCAWLSQCEPYLGITMLLTTSPVPASHPSYQFVLLHPSPLQPPPLLPSGNFLMTKKRPWLWISFWTSSPVCYVDGYNEAEQVDLSGWVQAGSL